MILIAPIAHHSSFPFPVRRGPNPNPSPGLALILSLTLTLIRTQLVAGSYHVRALHQLVLFPAWGQPPLSPVCAWALGHARRLFYARINPWRGLEAHT